MPGFKEERLRAGRVEAAFLLEDLGRKYRDVTALRYEGCDYQLPLLQANEHHRCAGGGGAETVLIRFLGPTSRWGYGSMP